MLCLAQRVKKASVRVNKDLVSSIDKGILLMVCFEQTDTQVQIDKLISKILDYSFFEGVSGKLDASLRKIGAELLIVSQFTLNASTKKGLKPSFHKAASPDLAEELYNKLKASINLEYKNVKYGVFGAYMELELTNDGPFTFNFSCNRRVSAHSGSYAPRPWGISSGMSEIHTAWFFFSDDGWIIRRRHEDSGIIRLQCFCY